MVMIVVQRHPGIHGWGKAAGMTQFRRSEVEFL